jgi:uncharacterized protein YcnI
MAYRKVYYMLNRIVTGLTISTIFMVSSVAVASAHVVVEPATTGIGAEQTYTMGVPNEKDQAVTAIRLLIP